MHEDKWTRCNFLNTYIVEIGKDVIFMRTKP